MEDDFQNKSDSFMAWLRQQGASISPKIELADLRSRGAGRGVVATADIEADEELFTIPRSAVLTVENSELFTRLRGQATEERMETLPVHDFRADFLDGLGPWVSLILVMMYEYLKGPESRWWPYFDVLPSKFDTLMFWSSDELDELQASA
ncbi:Ribosomal lysine N-methyltransferase 4, partial [Cryomyces antarcticus]